MHTQRPRGFTLIEMLFAVAMLAILASVALPTLSDMLARNRLVTSKNALVASLQLARAESAATSRNLVLCSSVDGRNCQNQGDWSQGWILFRDLNRNGRLDATDHVVQVHSLDASTLSIRSSDGRRRITYRGFGRAEGSNVRFVFCDQRNPQYQGEVVVANSGRIRSSNAAPVGSCG